MALAPAPHTLAVSRVLKNATRIYYASGTAASIALNAITGVAVTAPLPFSGTVSWTAGVPRYPTLTARLRKGATPVLDVVVNVNTSTGAFTGQFPANTTTAGSHTIRFDLDGPVTGTVTSSAFTMT